MARRAGGLYSGICLLYSVPHAEAARERGARGVKPRGALSQMLKRCLYESLDAELLERIAQDVLPGYDLRARTGFPPNIPVQVQTAASRVVEDCSAEERYLHLVERLARLEREGLIGRTYRIAGLRELSKAISSEGYLWDQDTSRFMEDPRVRRSPDWGRLAPGEELRFSLLRIDVVKNSRIVKKHGASAARDVYDELRAMLARCVERRSGRIWSWEGDGALAAFVFGHSTTSCVLAGIALMNELFMYNRTGNGLGEPLGIRAAAHTGPLRYDPELKEMLKQETCREVNEAEALWTPPDAFAITPAVAGTLDRVLSDRFKPIAAGGSRLLAYDSGMAEA